MPFLNTLRSFGESVQRRVGQLAHGVRRVGEFLKPAGAAFGKAARFVADHHQPLALLAKGVGDASGNTTLQNIGNAAVIGSSLATARGFGKDYGVYSRSPAS
jgi:hypothetical protein